MLGTTGWVAGPDMDRERYYHNLTLLPTGGVLAIGGMKVSYPRPKVYHPADGVYVPEYWHPSDSVWTDYASSDTVFRNYHSTAVLLPDGRVLTGGGWGDTLNGAYSPNPFMKKLQIFSPPYLFNSSGQLAQRPVIQGAPATIQWRRRFTVCVADTTGIRSACLVRPGAATHSVDMNQRFVPLTIEGRSTSPPRLFLTAPASPDSAPPGDYLLFVLGSSERTDVPSVARWVRLEDPTGADLCDTVKPATISDMFPEVVTSSSVWLVWTAPADDGLLAPSGLATGYLLRRSQSAINSQGTWDGATPVTGLPAPQPVTSYQDKDVTGLDACTTYHFALRADDDNSNRSDLHGEVSVQTMANGPLFICEGGGYAAREVTGGEDGGGGTVSAGAPPAATAALTPAAGVMITETRREPDGSLRVMLQQASEAEGVVPDDRDAIVVQVETGVGGWTTIARYRPDPAEGPLGLCSRRDRGRIILPVGYQLDGITAGIDAGGEYYSLVEADHSRLGDLGPALVDNGGSVALTTGDSLSLVYQATDQATSGAASWYLLARRTDGAVGPSQSAHPRPAQEIPQQFALHPSKPNPAASEVVLRFDLPVERSVKLEVFDLLGRRVATVVDALYPAGSHGAVWNLRDPSGTPVRPGVYVYRLAAGEFRAKGKMTVVR